MRVIAGRAKGIQLQAVPGTSTRPIADRVKEAVFNILGTDVVGAHILDLFAGTGSVGIEALSRGAEQAVFVEQHAKAVSAIRSNLHRTHLHALAQVVRTDVFRFLATEPQPFHLIYVAPPQYKGLWSRALLQLDANPGWLADDGLIIVQIFPKEFEPIPLANLHLVDERKYGSTLLCFYQAALPSSGA
jgi:16S rRNA (guanine(966)-N(2))-methyltransferase RsmD